MEGFFIKQASESLYPAAAEAQECPQKSLMEILKI